MTVSRLSSVRYIRTLVGVGKQSCRGTNSGISTFSPLLNMNSSLYSTCTHTNNATKKHCNNTRHGLFAGGPTHQTNRHFFGLFKNDANPFIEALTSKSGSDKRSSQTQTYINYSNMKPDHISKAATQLQSNYEEQLKIFEDSIGQDTQYEEFANELERITRPLAILQNNISLLSCVNKDAGFDSALHDANATIHLKHEFSETIRDALVRFEKQFSEAEAGEDEKLRVIQHLLRKHRLNGSMTGDPEITQQVTAIQKQLLATQSHFLRKSSLTMEQHGQVANPQELVPMMYKIVALQQHLSKLLGYESYADYSLDHHNAMAKSSNEIQAVHDMMEQIGAVKTFSSDAFQSAYLDLLSKDSSNSMKDYFYLDNVLSGMFDFCSALFGIKIEEQKNGVNGWHRDVRLFHVSNQGDASMQPIASFYLDPFRRQHKDIGCFMTPLQYKNETSIPVVAVSLDARPPVWDDAQVEMEVQNVVDIFHEFGHLFQHILADVKLGAFSGAQTMEEDASEIISQFMEYWLFDADGLTKLSRHNQTGESIPNDVMDKIKQQRSAKKATELLHRLFLGQLEVEMSSSFDPSGDESIIALQRRCAERFSPHNLPPKGNIDPLIQLFQTNAVGKCTMQYRYLWSEIMSADAFAAFVDENGDLKPEVQEIGSRLRSKWISAGSSVKTADAFESFRGRPAQADALVSRYEL